MKEELTDLQKERIKKLYSFKGYLEVFNENCLIAKKTKAWEMTEDEYYMLFGIEKFSSYDSFRQVKKRYLKKKIES